ncbi:probable membrane-associated kinase regulator 1 [Arachis ipaensis]|uniref:Uncharacterized protein n=1 Tax=Arachis hypogaea TaxID=3818 RepID=A0A444ZCV7_ARAHY|nr:probable membrane-associated kinase regulator 1 [Arachis ipaensis]XP_025645937.1 probable membrane-associated kinase regulator 1 [Arachis hypogaea]QHO06097.1 uncharacterized protein DS421_14g451740 [Arachis hypogaea]RYR11999.1 hypothetical protein Ahy_B04g069511 [Arachis hypogaea]
MESPCTTATRSDSTSSPEFEFWMLRNPSFPQPNLHSADELFVDGVLLPLHLLPSTSASKPDPPPDPEQLTTSGDPSDASSSAAIITESSTSTTTTLSTSKRWKDIFKKKNTENNDTEEKEKDKGKKKKKKEIKKTGSGAGSAAELNINIWPFSRSRSAGNAVTRPKLFAGAPSSTRKVNSAPCSRSNSTGDSKSRKWPSSPGRPGVHVGRTSPVWQVRRTKNSNNTPAQDNDGAEAKKRESAACQRRGTKARVLNLNVPMCIGYGQHLSCRCDENGGAVSGTTSVRGGDNNDGGSCSGGEGSNNDGGSGVNLFNLRNLFTKKSIVTSH